MGWLRPRRKVTAPGGVEWELYVYRVRTPAWREGGGEDLFQTWWAWPEAVLGLAAEALSAVVRVAAELAGGE